VKRILYLGEKCLRESRRSDRDCTVGIGREDESVRHRQVQSDQERPRYGMQPRHPVDVEERVHAGVLSRSQVNEQFLSAAKAEQAQPRNQDVRQGSSL